MSAGNYYINNHNHNHNHSLFWLLITCLCLLSLHSRGLAQFHSVSMVPSGFISKTESSSSPKHFHATKDTTNTIIDETDEMEGTEQLVQNMLIQLNAMHQAFFTNFTRLWHFADLFNPNGSWWMPVGLHRDGDLRTGPDVILKSLQSWSSLLSGERSWMSDVIISGNSGAYWWRDVYSRPSGCMFSSLGYNQFFIDSSTALMSYQNTWMDVEDGQAQGSECGITPQHYTIDSQTSVIYNEVITVLSNISSEAAQNFPATFALNATFWEPVGVESGKVKGQAAIAQLWMNALQVFQGWSNVVIHDPIYAGNSVGVDIVLTFVTKAGCPYTIREFIAILVDGHGLISDFQVHYDRRVAEAARAACGM